MPQDKVCLRCGTPIPSVLGGLFGLLFGNKAQESHGAAPVKPQVAHSAPPERHHRSKPSKPTVGTVSLAPPALDEWGLAIESRAVGSVEDAKDAAWGIRAAHSSDPNRPVGTVEASDDAAWGLRPSEQGDAAWSLNDDAVARFPGDGLDTAAGMNAPGGHVRAGHEKPEHAKADSSRGEHAKPGQAHSHPSEPGHNWREVVLNTAQHAKAKDSGAALVSVLEALSKSPGKVEYAPGREKPKDAGEAIARVLRGEPLWPKMGHWVPAAATFFLPGSGQVIQGRLKLGVGLWVATWTFPMLTAILQDMFGHDVPHQFLGSLPLLYSVGIAYEAYNHNKRLSERM